MPTPSSTTLVARRDTLDGFTNEVAGNAGVSLAGLDPLTTLHVRTHNSHYVITVSQGTAVLVRGGAFFPVVTQARLEGASLGGSLLKVAWIGVGLRMEICAEGRRIVTSPVQSIVAEGGVARAH